MSRFTERTMGAGRVDREAGVIYGAKLVSRISRNHRQYTHDALAEAAPKYDGKKVYLDHPEEDKFGDDRKIDHWIGTIVNPRYEGGAIYGEIKLRKRHPKFAEIVEMVEEFPNAVGMSHVAEGSSRFEGGEEIVDHIVEVYSVDLVTEPATTAGFFEAIGHLGIDDGPTMAGLIPKLRGVVVKALKIPTLADSEELAYLVDVIDQTDEKERVKAGAEKIGFEPTDDELDRRDPPMAESHDCFGRPKIRETTSDGLRRFANRLR